MVKRTAEQWQALIEEQQTSGLTATAFCRQHKINPKYFSTLKGRFKHTQPAPFVRAQVPIATASPQLHYRDITLVLDNCSAHWVAQLLQALPECEG